MKLKYLPMTLLLGVSVTPSVIPFCNVSNVKADTVTSNNLNPDNIDSLTETLHTPFYHLETAQGWSNDLQSIIYDPSKDGYDLYFLHSADGATNPFGSKGQNWEHVFSKDLVHFEKQNEAIPAQGSSNNPDSWKSAWTGSVITNRGQIQGVPKGAEVAYFSGLSKKDGSQNIYACWSSDNGSTFSHPLNNGSPVLAYNQTGASGKSDQERDSFVTYDPNGKMIMYCAEGNQLGVYKSDNGINWTKADPNGASKVLPSTFFKGLQWDDGQNSPVECPQLISIKAPNGQVKQVLFYGCKDLQNGQTTGTYYVVGHLDNNGLFVAETNAKRADNGSDYYGGNIQTSPLDEPVKSVVMMGWIGNWNYTSQGVHNSQDGQGVYTGRLGSYSLPRTFELDNNLNLKFNFSDVGLLNQGVDFDSQTTLGAEYPIINDDEKDAPIVAGNDEGGKVYQVFEKDNAPVASKLEFKFGTLEKSPYKGRIYIDIVQGKDHVLLNYDPTNGNYRVSGKATELDNDLSGTKASSYYYDGLLGNGQGYACSDGKPSADNNQITIFTDKDSEEIQLPNGSMYTIARFATSDKQDIKVYMQDETSDKGNYISYDLVGYNKITNDTSDNSNVTVDKASSTNKSSSLANNTSKNNSSINYDTFSDKKKSSSMNSNSNNKNSSSLENINSSADKSVLTSTNNSKSINNGSSSLINSVNTNKNSFSSSISNDNLNKDVSSLSKSNADSSLTNNVDNNSINKNSLSKTKSNTSSSIFVDNKQDEKIDNTPIKQIKYVNGNGKTIKNINVPKDESVEKTLADNLPKGIKNNQTHLTKKGKQLIVRLPQTGEAKTNLLKTLGVSIITISSILLTLLGIKNYRKIKK